MERQFVSVLLLFKLRSLLQWLTAASSVVPVAALCNQLLLLLCYTATTVAALARQ
jgi:hypothetical protein